NRVETGFLYLDIIEMESEVSNLYREITALCGINVKDTIIIPDKRNIYNSRNYNLQDLVETALNNRSDYLAAKIAVELSHNEIRAAKRERVPEFELSFGYNINKEAVNIDAPTPAFKGFEVGLSFPIPIFNRNKGEILAAQYEKRANQYLLKEAENKLSDEVFSAYDRFRYCSQKLELFKSGLVKNAMDALEEKKREYYQGKIHMIEVLDAQRSYDEILSSFYSVIYNKSQALVNLESTIGLWRIFDPMDSF
ncbi:MAG: TolC family protein, partial [Bacteroidales bacterium]